LYEDSFEELAGGKEVGLPQFDFITLHGIYTWVSGDNQKHIVDFIARYLKPGGVVFISYNAMPGWTSVLPLQRLLVEYGDAFPDRSDMQIKGATEMVRRMQASKAAYFSNNPALESRLAALTSANTNYLVHEYMHKHWEPRYHADIARDLAGAKLEFVGSADLSFAYPSLYFTDDKQAVVNTMSGSAMRETMKDYFLNTAFRKDVFVRGARKMTPVRQSEWLAQVGLALTSPRNEAPVKINLPIGQLEGKSEVFGPVLDALAERPRTIAQLHALPQLQGRDLANMVQAAALLTASGQVHPYLPSSVAQSSDKAHKMNRALANLARYSDEHQVLCSALLGNGQSASFVERMVLLCLLTRGEEPDLAKIISEVVAAAHAQGRRMIKGGVILESDADNLAEIENQIRTVLAFKFPLWLQLKIVERAG
jgi:SAM-dependent methyltransferase